MATHVIQLLRNGKKVDHQPFKMATSSFETFTGSSEEQNCSHQWAEWLERLKNDLVAWTVAFNRRKKSNVTEICWRSTMEEMVITF